MGRYYVYIPGRGTLFCHYEGYIEAENEEEVLKKIEDNYDQLDFYVDDWDDVDTYIPEIELMDK